MQEQPAGTRSQTVTWDSLDPISGDISGWAPGLNIQNRQDIDVKQKGYRTPGEQFQQGLGTWGAGLVASLLGNAISGQGESQDILGAGVSGLGPLIGGFVGRSGGIPGMLFGGLISGLLQGIGARIQGKSRKIPQIPYAQFLNTLDLQNRFSALPESHFFSPLHYNSNVSPSITNNNVFNVRGGPRTAQDVKDALYENPYRSLVMKGTQ